MSAEDRINALMQIHPKGFDLSLDRIRGLLEKLDNPHLRIPPVIHVAGTNGKGSTIAFCRAILEASGHSVHVHTSPHLVNWHERFRIGGKDGGRLVSDPMLEDAINRVANANGGKPITVFEILSAVMFLLFSENPADYCLIEVGLGGRFDATNVIENPKACVITPVALDHQAYLGETIAEIAGEKAGIIKPGAAVIVGPQEDEARDIIETKAAEFGIEPVISGQDFEGYSQSGRFVYQDGEGLLDLPMPNLIGEHQASNAATAIAVIRSLDIPVTHEQYELAMTNVSWPGRMQRLRHGPVVEALGSATQVWVDGGHNPSAGEVIARELMRQNRQVKLPTFMICAMLTTKEPSGYFEAFTGLLEEVITIPVASSDAGFDPVDLASHASGAGLNATAMNSLDEAISALAKNAALRECRVILAGTLYLAGDVLAKNNTPPD